MARTDHPDFPHPYVAVDVVVLAVVDGRVRVVLVERDVEDADRSGVAGPGLPGVYLQLDERIGLARARVLARKCGVVDVPEDAYRPLTPRDDPDRDPRRRTISLVSWAPVAPRTVAALAPTASLGTLDRSSHAIVVRLDGTTVRLAVDHEGMVTDAVEGLAAEVDHLDPAGGALPALLPPVFTARDVETVLTAVGALVGRPAPDTNALRRRLGPLTEGTGELEPLGPGQRHRPAELRRWAQLAARRGLSRSSG